MYTPDSYNNDPARIMRAELRAELRAARAQERRTVFLMHPARRVRRRASRILLAMAEALAGPAGRERRRPPCSLLVPHLVDAHAAGNHSHGASRCPHL